MEINMEKVNGKLFTADDIGCATILRGQSLTNMLTRSDLALVSEPPGRGRSRLFPLIDVYQLAIAGILTKVSGDMQWAAGAANYVLCGPFGELVLQPDERLSDLSGLSEAMGGAAVSVEQLNRFREAGYERISRVAVDIKKGPQEYWNRDRDNPDFLVAETNFDGRPSLSNTPFRAPTITKNPVNFARGGIRIAGIIVSITALLDEVDRLLMNRLEQRNK